MAADYKVDVYYCIRINGPITMPCGAEVTLTGKNQPCPNSGNCAKGARECWVEFYDKEKVNGVG